MKPLLQEGKTQVVLLPLTQPLKKGDLPLYQRPNGQYVLHRVVSIRDGNCYTRGDNRYNLERIEADWVLGVTSAVIRHGKTCPVTSRRYRMYVTCWLASYPLRNLLHRFGHGLANLRRKLVHHRRSA